MRNFIWLSLTLLLSTSSLAVAAEGQWVSRLKFSDNNRETLVVGSDARVSAGERYRSVVVLWGDLDFSGRVDEMVVLSGNVHLRPGSRVEKSLVVLGGNLQRDDGAFIEGDQIQFQAPSDFPKPLLLLAPYLGFAAEGSLWIFSKVLWLLLTWVSGLLAYKIAPHFFQSVEQAAMAAKAKNLLVAAMAILLFVPSIFLFLISIIGIPFLPLYMVLYAVSISCAYVALGSLIGQWLPPKMAEPRYRPLRLLYGLSVLLLVRMLIPILGTAIVMVLAFITWGALLRITRQRFFLKTK